MQAESFFKITWVNMSHKIDQTASSYDVAKLAGVSQSTVSRIFNRGARVSEKTKARVMAAVQELGYQPNNIARSLTQKSTKLIGLVISKLNNPIFAQVLDEFSIQLAQAGYNTLLLNISSDQEIEDAIAKAMQNRVDGIIFTAAGNVSTQLAQECLNVNIPVILYDRYSRYSKLNAVLCDSYDGSYRITQHLIETGHTNIALIGAIKNEDDPSSATDREQGCLNCLRDNQLDCSCFKQGDNTYENTLKIARDILSGATKIDAVVCANDLMAMAVMDIARTEFNLKIPDDLSVTGFNGILQANWKQYQLTTIKQPVTRLVELTISRLLEMINNQDSETVLRKLPGKLFIGTSTRNLIF
jgi:DNA-binding LacI/PurR family transcriptional regulator